MRPIDADALRNVFDAMHAIAGGSHLDHLVLLGIKKYIDDAPTIDAVPVVHGRWIEHPQYDVFGDCCYIDYECSVCHNIACEDAEHYAYCPHCGQPMDAKDMDVPTKDGGAADGSD